MVSVSLDGIELANCDSPVILEGNYYFPPDSVHSKRLKPSDTSSVCPWKGTASYYSADVAGKTVHDIAWYYSEPKPDAAHIKGHVAFYKNKAHIQD